ncbi:MAG TPA: septation protein SepH [Egibacteraceae bacterium]|nr:septation protein SepH [Egibacteraceae bacterium]
MIELQLVGYTADLKYLVFCDVGESASRFKAPVDEELLATLGEVVQLVDPDRTGMLVPTPPAPPPASAAGADREPPFDGGRGPQPGQGPLAALAVVVPAEVEEPGNGQPDQVLRRRTSRLSPREIQALLRAGKSPRTVAKQAGTDEAWVRRWLPPIDAERDRVLQAVQQARATKAGADPSGDALGDAVRKNLAARGITPDDEGVDWTAARSEAETSWKVSLRLRAGGRRQSAVWRFDPETGTLESRNSLGAELGWTRPRRTRRAKKASRAKTAGGAKSAGGAKPAGRAKAAGRSKTAATAGRASRTAPAEATAAKTAKAVAKDAATAAGAKAGVKTARAKTAKDPAASASAKAAAANAAKAAKARSAKAAGTSTGKKAAAKRAKRAGRQKS